MDAIYLYNKHGKPMSYAQWLDVRYIADFVCGVWNQQDMSIWEVRGRKTALHLLQNAALGRGRPRPTPLREAQLPMSQSQQVDGD